MIKYILQLMEEIEQDKPLSDFHEANGRYVFPERWNSLKKMLKRLQST